jgi:hypothetical protein
MADTGTGDMYLADLKELAAQARRYLMWACFLLLVMAGILILDVQIKRSVARQAVAASETLARAVSLADGRRQTPDVAATPDDSGVGGGGSGDAVDGSTPVAAGPDPQRGAKPPGRRGVAKRSPGDEP